MNFDPRELFGEKLLTPAMKGVVIETIRQWPLSAGVKRTAYARWCETVGVEKDPNDFRKVARKAS